jgi:hypothetical protein
MSTDIIGLPTISSLILPLGNHSIHTFVWRTVRCGQYAQIDDLLTPADEMPVRSLDLNREIGLHLDSH